jgi:hypothetical protein
MVVNKEGKIEMTPQELANLKKEVIFIYYPTYPTLSYSSPTISFPDNYPWIYYSTPADGTCTVKYLDQAVINS